MHLRDQIERSNEEVAHGAKMLKERELLASLQKARIDDLERSAALGDFRRDPHYILRSESDNMIEAMKQSLMDEFKKPTPRAGRVLHFQVGGHDGALQRWLGTATGRGLERVGGGEGTPNGRVGGCPGDTAPFGV